jgi:hypothetical protein
MTEQVYNPDYHPEQAELICGSTGASPTQLGNIFGVSAQAVFNWRARYPEFSRAMDRGLDHFRAEVAEANLAKCMAGYHYNEITYGFDGEGKRAKKKEIRKFRPRDVDAIKFFLANRFPDRWGKKAEESDEATDTLRQILKDIGADAQAASPGPARGRDLKAL